MSNDFNNFLEIRKAYQELLPQWIAEYEKTGNMRHDPYFMDWQFTPIERHVWSDIRALGLPFYPQVPVLNYFIDFACPMMKIGVECDGKAWHMHDLDKARDARLAAEGWMIFRIEGHECFRVVDPWDDCLDLDDSERADLVNRYYMTTSEGILKAIKQRYFETEGINKYRYLIESTLFEHRSTFEISTSQIPVEKNNGPVLIAECLSDYIEQLKLKIGNAAA
jgi:very-short-patch-repair endonuclease